MQAKSLTTTSPLFRTQRHRYFIQNIVTIVRKGIRSNCVRLNIIMLKLFQKYLLYRN